MASDLSELIELLGLQPHPEGGWYRETWKTSATGTPAGYPGPRAYATGIYFLLHPGEISRPHTVRSDELWLWHRGGPLRLTIAGEEHVLGPDVAKGELPQLLVPAGALQSAEPAGGTEPTLVSCIVSPGFDFEDFTMEPE
ncbi:cupin domain-containing protein [Streptomyces sp. NPDC050738]|uniref:cupin domain-containing protein n=1 Tax=Streptomyces sp. NPDC050738 TaxID=3154744 RepID=UPI0034290F67